MYVSLGLYPTLDASEVIAETSVCYSVFYEFYYVL